MRIGGTKHLKIKEIIDLNPDLVIGNKEENTKEDIQQLERNGITVWMSDINSFDEALSMIQQIGSIFSKDRESKQLCANILNGFHKLKDVGKSQRVLYFIWDEPSIVVGKNTFINAIIELLGFVNTCYLNRYPYLDQLSNIHPDFVFLSSEPFPFSKVHIEKFQKLFPNSKVIPVDGEMFSWYGSRMQLALKYFSSNAFEK
jgi:ABC-type Fe3+-hydroxamate transport system substrate-binding protein